MTVDRLATLASRLYDRTVEGGGEWEPGPLSESYVAKLSDYTVRLGKIKPDAGAYGMSAGDNEPIFTLQIHQDNKVVEQVSSAQASVAELLPFLYEEARRHASHVDSAIDDILAILEP